MGWNVSADCEQMPRFGRACILSRVLSVEEGSEEPMGTFLLTWNPSHPKAWEDVKEAAAKAASGKPHRMRWSTGNTKSIKTGDRVFLLRQVVDPKGIVAAGTVMTG